MVAAQRRMRVRCFALNSLAQDSIYSALPDPHPTPLPTGEGMHAARSGVPQSNRKV